MYVEVYEIKHPDLLSEREAKPNHHLKRRVANARATQLNRYQDLLLIQCQAQQPPGKTARQAHIQSQR
jgi:hypothetical protein